MFVSPAESGKLRLAIHAEGLQCQIAWDSDCGLLNWMTGLLKSQRLQSHPIN
jgi:hypothetical protein